MTRTGPVFRELVYSHTQTSLYMWVCDLSLSGSHWAVALPELSLTGDGGRTQLREGLVEEQPGGHQSACCVSDTGAGIMLLTPHHNPPSSRVPSSHGVRMTNLRNLCAQGDVKL